MTHSGEPASALVTGASRGLGAAIAEVAAGAHSHIIVCGRTVGALEELDDRIREKGGAASLAVTDICDIPSLLKLADNIQTRWGRLDLLVHAAIHVPPLSPVAHGTAEDLGKAARTNLLATERLIAICDPLLKRSSRAAAIFFDDPRGGQSFCGRYASTKAAQIALARCWQSESRKLGIHVAVVQPQPMRTALRMRFYPGEDRADLAEPMQEARRITTQLQESYPETFDWLNNP